MKKNFNSLYGKFSELRKESFRNIYGGSDAPTTDKTLETNGGKISPDYMTNVNETVTVYDTDKPQLIQP